MYQIDGIRGLYTYHKLQYINHFEIAFKSNISFTYYKKKNCWQNGATAKLNKERDFFDNKADFVATDQYV